MTAPAQLQMGGVERVCVTLHGSFDADEEFEINISLKKLQDSDTTYISQSMVFFGSNDLNLTALIINVLKHIYGIYFYLFLTDPSTCLNLTLPSDMAVSDFERVDLHMRLLVLGTGQEFNDEIPVYLRRGNSQITFIQTDKPKYKPGQTGERI